MAWPRYIASISQGFDNTQMGLNRASAIIYNPGPNVVAIRRIIARLAYSGIARFDPIVLQSIRYTGPIPVGITSTDLTPCDSTGPATHLIRIHAALPAGLDLSAGTTELFDTAVLPINVNSGIGSSQSQYVRDLEVSPILLYPGEGVTSYFMSRTPNGLFFSGHLIFEERFTPDDSTAPFLSMTRPVAIVAPNPLPVHETSPLVLPTMLSAPINLTVTGSGGTGIIVPAVSGKRIRVYAVNMDTLSSISVNFRSGLSTSLEGPMPFASKAGYTESVTPPACLFSTAVGEALYLVITSAGSAYGRVSYWLE